MSFLDVLRLASSALLKDARRSGLSLLGVAIGVAAVVLLTSLGEGARGFVYAQFQSLGTNVVAILPGKVETTGGLPGFGGVPHDLTLEDARTLQRGLPELLHVAPIVVANDTVSFHDKSRQVVVVGATPEFQPVRNLDVQLGRFLPEDPWERSTPVAVIGRRIVRELFPGENPLGKRVRIGSFRMRVVGVLGDQGVHFGLDMDDVVIVPVATAMRSFDRRSLFRILMQAGPGADLGVVERRAHALIEERHGEEDFTITTPDAILGALSSILRALTMALVGIAAISLSVAGIGIMNVMLVSVSERTREIGLCKALGAGPGQLLGLFLTEAALLSAVGGATGLLAGALLVEAASRLYPAFPAQVPLWAAVAAMLLSIGVGVVFGVLPARRAVRLDPVEALARR